MKTKLISLIVFSLITPFIAFSKSTPIPQTTKINRKIANSKDKVIPYSSVESSCSENEYWVFATRTGKLLEEKLAKSLKEKKLNLNTLLEFESLRKSEKDPHNQMLLEYFYWRLFFNNGLISASHRGFNKMIEKYSFHSDTASIFIGTVQCVNRIYNQYPTLGLTKEASKVVQSQISKPLLPKYKEILVLAFSNYLKKQISAGLSAESIWNDTTAIEEFPEYANFIKTLVSASLANETDTIEYGNRFFQSKNSENFPSHQKDLLHLEMGRAYYGKQDFNNAILNFKKVKNTSNLFTQAIVGSTWSHLLKRDYQGAVGESENLLLGNLRHTFAPEANMVSAIAFIETCNYGDAIENIKYFRRNYHKIYSYLFHWSNHPEKQSYYKMVIEFLKNKSKVPDRIGTEWIRSPVFIANQDELNLLISENKKYPVIIKFIGAIKAPKYNPGQIQASLELKKLINILDSNYKPKEKQLIAEINKDIQNRTRQLWANLNSANQNMQLVEAEAYSSFGEQVIEDQALSENPELALAKKKKEKKSQEQSSGSFGSTWDWGRFPTQTNPDEDEPEIWEDELGFLRADTSNKCTGDRAPSSPKDKES